jgi:regulator of cell morphogenesis and NO signaling
MTTTTAPTAPAGLASDVTIGEIVATRPALARLFEQLGIDYCCGGKQTLAAACAKLGLDLGTTRALLDSAARALQAGPPEVDAMAMGLTELADHIERSHHAYLKEELPRLVEMAERVAQRHADKDARLAEVARVTVELAEEMMCHMQKEEVILFPLVRQIDAGKLPDAGLLAGPIAQMEDEHQTAGDATSRLRLLTDGFALATAVCNTHRALLDGLARFEADLHRHVHKENNVLFPRALQRAAAEAGTKSA